MRNMTRLGLVAGLGLFLAGCVDDGYRGGGGYYRGYSPGYVAGPVYRGPVYRGPAPRPPAYYGPPPRRDWGGRDYRRDDRRAHRPGPPSPPPRQGPPPQRRESGDAMRNFFDRNR